MLVCLYLVVNIFSLIVFIDYFPPNQKCKSMNFSHHLTQFPVLVCTEVGIPSRYRTKKAAVVVFDCGFVALMSATTIEVVTSTRCAV